MLKSIEIIRKPREMILNMLTDITIEQLNHIPQGFNNNIIWNVAHMISAQQGIFYTRTGLPLITDEKYYAPFRPDTKPSGFIEAGEVDIIKGLFLSTIDQLEIDIENKSFTNYPAWRTRYGVEISSVDDALAFLPFHEGLHCGYITASKRLLTG